VGRMVGGCRGFGVPAPLPGRLLLFARDPVADADRLISGSPSGTHRACVAVSTRWVGISLALFSFQRFPRY
jgi:hypothetical protein